MATYRIAVVVGSLRKDSFNRRLARALEPLFPAGFSFEHLRIDDLPTGSGSVDALHAALFELAGVDGVFTDFPDRTRAYLDAAAGRGDWS